MNTHSRCSSFLQDTPSAPDLRQPGEAAQRVGQLLDSQHFPHSYSGSGADASSPEPATATFLHDTCCLCLSHSALSSLCHEAKLLFFQSRLQHTSERGRATDMRQFATLHSLARSSVFGARRHHSRTTSRRRKDRRRPWTIRIRSAVLAKDTPMGSISIGRGYEFAPRGLGCCASEGLVVARIRCSLLSPGVPRGCGLMPTRPTVL